jgi:hypothetical protein
MLQFKSRRQGRAVRFRILQNTFCRWGFILLLVKSQKKPNSAVIIKGYSLLNPQQVDKKQLAFSVKMQLDELENWLGCNWYSTDFAFH